MFIDRKKDDVAFWEMAPKNLIETKELLLASIDKRDIFLNIRVCTISSEHIKGAAYLDIKA